MGACSDRPDFRYETEHLRIATQFDEPLCRGNLDHLERLVTTLEDQLDTSVDKAIEVHIWDQQRSEDPGWCSQDYLLGCFIDGSVYTDTLALDHELVHAVVATMGAPAPFWREGVAEALQSDRTLRGSSSPTANLELDTPQLSYLTAGHFSRWLVETHGIESYRALLRAPGSAREAFENTYDMSFEEAEDQYEAEAPYSYGALIACNHPELPNTEELMWSETLEVDCYVANVHSTVLGMSAFRVLTITEAGDYAFSTSGEQGYIARCEDEDLEQEPVAGDPQWGDVPPTLEGFIYQYARTFTGDGEITVYTLTPGRYEVATGYSDFSSRTASLSVWADP